MTYRPDVHTRGRSGDDFHDRAPRSTSPRGKYPKKSKSPRGAKSPKRYKSPKRAKSPKRKSHNRRQEGGSVAVKSIISVGGRKYTVIKRGKFVSVMMSFTEAKRMEARLEKMKRKIKQYGGSCTMCGGVI